MLGWRHLRKHSAQPIIALSHLSRTERSDNLWNLHVLAEIRVHTYMLTCLVGHRDESLKIKSFDFGYASWICRALPLLGRFLKEASEEAAM
eukprot:1814669-Amphidinium_carterae.1